MHRPAAGCPRFADTQVIFWPFTALLGLFLLELAVSDPALAQSQQAPLVISAPGIATWTVSRMLPLTATILVGDILAWIRLKMRFREFSGLGVFSNWYSWSFLGFVGVLSSFSYSGITGVETLLLNTLGRSFPAAFMTSLALGGGGGGGHALIALGRFVRPRRNPPLPGSTDRSRDTMTANFILDFFYYGIRVCVAKRMHLEIKRMAETYDWQTIQRISLQLLKDWMTVGTLADTEGKELIRKIAALRIPSEASLADTKYDVLTWTIAKSSFSELRSRLLRTTPATGPWTCLSDVPGITPLRAELLEQSGVDTIANLAEIQNVEELSAHSGIPLDWLQQWHLFAKQKIAVLKYRRNVAIALSTIALTSLVIVPVWLSANLEPQLKAANVQFELGNSLYYEHKYHDAIAAYRKALAIKPDYAEAHNNLGVALYDNGQYADAIVEYKKALALKSDYAGALYNLGNVLARKGHYDDAIVEYEKALIVKPDYAEAHISLGNALVERRRCHEAIAQDRTALALEPNNAGMHVNFGVALAENGQSDDAIAEYKKALDLGLESAEVHNNLGNALAQSGQYDAAIAEIKKALALKPDYADAYNNLGYTLAKSGHFDEALANVQKSLTACGASLGT